MRGSSMAGPGPAPLTDVRFSERYTRRSLPDNPLSPFPSPATGRPQRATPLMDSTISTAFLLHLRRIHAALERDHALFHFNVHHGTVYVRGTNQPGFDRNCMAESSVNSPTCAATCRPCSSGIPKSAAVPQWLPSADLSLLTARPRFPYRLIAFYTREWRIGSQKGNDRAPRMAEGLKISRRPHRNAGRQRRPGRKSPADPVPGDRRRHRG